MNFEHYFNFSSQPSGFKEKYDDQLSFDSFPNLRFPDFLSPQAYEHTQFSKSNTIMDFSPNMDPFADSSYQVASNAEVSPAGSTPLNKKIQKQRKRQDQAQKTPKGKEDERNVPKPADDDEGAHSSHSFPDINVPAASGAQTELLARNPAAITIPKNLFELSTAFSVSILEKVVYKISEDKAIDEVINCLGRQTLVTNGEALLESVKEFRAEVRRSHGSVKDFLSEDKNANQIKAVFNCVFTPESDSLKYYLLSAKKMEEANRNSLQKPEILEQLRRKMENNQ